MTVRSHKSGVKLRRERYSTQCIQATLKTVAVSTGAWTLTLFSLTVQFSNLSDIYQHSLWSSCVLHKDTIVVSVLLLAISPSIYFTSEESGQRSCHVPKVLDSERQGQL